MQKDEKWTLTIIWHLNCLVQAHKNVTVGYNM